MEDFKRIVKGVFRKFSDKGERKYIESKVNSESDDMAQCLSNLDRLFENEEKPLVRLNKIFNNTYPSIRMSEINTSLTSVTVTSLHRSTFKSAEDDITDTKQENESANDIMNNLKATTDAATVKSLAKMNNNNVTVSRIQDQKDENKNKLPKLKIINHNQLTSPVQDLVNNLSKQQSAVEKNMCESMKTKRSSPITPKQNKPIMGRIALLKKANVERSDSSIIHELITNRYNGVLNHYYNRMYQRRKSKIDSSEDEYSDTVFSSPPNCSPLSFSSIDTPSSGFLDERSGFDFSRNLKERKDLGFLKSTDDVNVDTTVEDLDASSLSSSAISNDKSMTSFSEYDQTKFLDNAIGEVTNVSSESGIANDEPERKDTSQRTKNSSIGPSDISSLLSRASCMYSSVKNSMRRNSVHTRGTPQNEDHVKDNNRQSVVSDNSLLDSLMRELSLQNEILFQVSKALNYCRTMKGFETTVEFIEAEKILLLASCTKAALTKEIENVDDDTYEKKDDPRSCGQINLTNLRFFPNEEYKNNVHGEPTEHFVLIVTCGSTVLASDVITARDGGEVYTEKNFEFRKLPTDFEISICIYSMRLHNKSHHNKDQSGCPSAKKFFLNKVSRRYKVSNESLYIRPSSFLLHGRCDIRSPDLSKMKSSNDTSPVVTLKMHNIPLNSSLSGMFSINIKSSVQLNNKMSGFLTIGLDNEHGCIIWNVRWCVLEGTVLKYWNHPSEEVTHALGSLDLNYCLEQPISAVDRSLCARPRTLMVPVKYKEGERKYLLSADKLSDLKQWENELNYVLRALDMWNCGGAKIP